MTITEIITLLSIALTFGIGMFNLIVAFRNGRKTAFINSVTVSRLKYVNELRDRISRFCGLVHSYANRLYKLEYKEVWELHKEADNLRYLIRLYLNPEDRYWNGQITSLIDEIMLQSDKDPKPAINKLITVTQYILKLEWEVVKLESQKGILTKKEKTKVYDEYVERHGVSSAQH